MKTLLLLSALLLSACTQPQDPQRPYQCFNLEQPESEWTCTYLDKPLGKEEMELMRSNIKNGKKGREAQ